MIQKYNTHHSEMGLLYTLLLDYLSESLNTFKRISESINCCIAACVMIRSQVLLPPPQVSSVWTPQVYSMKVACYDCALTVCI